MLISLITIEINNEYIFLYEKDVPNMFFYFSRHFFIAYFESNNSFFFFCRCYFASFISCLALPGEPSSKILSFVHGREERVEGVTRSEREREREPLGLNG